MTILDYILEHGPVWRDRRNVPGVLVQGMLLFTEDSAHSLAGPFPGNYGYYRLTDYRKTVPPYDLRTEAEHRQRIRFSHHYIPGRLHHNPAQSEEQLQARLRPLTQKQRKAWQASIDNARIDCPTVENPVALYIAGNDDASWTNFYPDQDAAYHDLALLHALQPLDLDKDVLKSGFVFTN